MFPLVLPRCLPVARLFFLAFLAQHGAGVVAFNVVTATACETLHPVVAFSFKHFEVVHGVALPSHLVAEQLQLDLQVKLPQIVECIHGDVLAVGRVLGDLEQPGVLETSLDRVGRDFRSLHKALDKVDSLRIDLFPDWLEERNVTHRGLLHYFGVLLGFERRCPAQ